MAAELSHSAATRSPVKTGCQRATRVRGSFQIPCRTRAATGVTRYRLPSLGRTLLYRTRPSVGFVARGNALAPKIGGTMHRTSGFAAVVVVIAASSALAAQSPAVQEPAATQAQE